MNQQESPEDWARMLKREWQARSQSSARDFFIASAPGWDDRQEWERWARKDLEWLLQGLDPSAVANFQVLEIGCGVGRLVPPLAPLVYEYTGFDISPGMVQEAESRCKEQTNARFFETDGLGVPAQAQDRQYDLIFALAVFIHCPRDVVASLVKSSSALLAPGGQLRFQLQADVQDLSGLDPDFDLEALKQEAANTDSSLPPGVAELIEGHYYMGEHFRFGEVVPFMEEHSRCQAEAFRVSPLHIWGVLKKPDAGSIPGDPSP